MGWGWGHGARPKAGACGRTAPEELKPDHDLGVFKEVQPYQFFRMTFLRMTRDANADVFLVICGLAMAGGAIADFSAQRSSRKIITGGYCNGVGGVGNALGWPVT